MKRIATTILTAMILAGLAGCDGMNMSRGAPQQQAATAPAQEPARKAEPSYLTKPAADSGAETKTNNAVETALDLMKRNREAVDKIDKLQQENHDLMQKQLKLQDQVGKLQADLTLAQKELQDANEMMMEMRKNLEKWQGNVLGFRQEIRDAQQAQLNTMTKIVRLLGGDVGAASQPATLSQPASAPAKETAP